MGEIAVFTDENGNLVNFYHCVQMKIYHKEETIFQLKEIIGYEKIEPTSPLEIRRRTEALLALLKSCNTVAFKEILGIPFAVFNQAGCNIFSINEVSEALLEEIENDVNSLQEEKRKQEEIGNRPVETDIPGVYFFDLLQAQEKYPALTSKKALQPFFDTVPFLELRLICAHMPPWLERNSRFQIKTEKNGKELFSVIAFKQC